MDTFANKLSQCNERIGDQAAWLATIQDKFNEVPDSTTAKQEETDTKITSLDEDIAVLFEERDALYEMLNAATKRIEELEKTNAKASESTNALETNQITTKLEQSHKELMETFKKEQNDRVKGLVEEQTERMKQQTQGKSERLAKLERERNEQNERIEKFKAEQKECVMALAKEQLERIRRHKNDQNERIAKLEKDRNEQNDRIDKLEDLIRVLTAQSPVTSSPASQILAVHTTNGQSLDLAVPKGRSYAPYTKENIRSFTPGY